MSARLRSVPVHGLRHVLAWTLLLTGFWSAGGSAAAAPGATTGAVDGPDRQILRAFLDAPAGIRIEGRRLEVDALRRLYQPRRFAPIWSGDEAAATRAALLLRALGAAPAHGLDPGRYRLQAIRARPVDRWPDDPAAVEREVLLTRAFLDYAGDVASGRVPPDRVEPDWVIAPPHFDAAAALARALRDEDFPALLAALPPPAAGYQRLIEALDRYRAIEASGGWPAIPPGPPLAPGDTGPRTSALWERLAAEARLPAPPPGEVYDPDLEAAVRRFQARHGLAVDGIVGPATLRTLNVPAAARVHQIALNLERWRWLPRDLGPRHIVVNAADASLVVVVDGRPALASRVVVGDRRHRTPVVHAQLGAIVFNPPWNIPTSIAANEILPRLRRERHYLRDNDIVVVDRRDRDPFGLQIDWSVIARDRFPFRLQQQPGPANPLGRVKFETPNRFDVHLHDTPARGLFARISRTASHGCVRVERARELAALVLAMEPSPWDASRLENTIATGNTQRVPLARPLPVYLLYWTAFVDEDGMLQFREDVYGRDGRLAEALMRLAPPAPAAPPGPAVGCPEPPPRSRGTGP